MSEEIIKSKRMPGVLIAGLWLAVILTAGFVDIQPKWADNAFIVNIPVYVFGVLAMTDTFVIGTGKHFRASE